MSTGRSKDLVEFFLPGYNGSSPKKEDAIVLAATKAFGLSEATVRRIMSFRMRLRARPSQFARFLIYRHEHGADNLFACMEPRLLAQAEPQFMDVSGN